MQIRLKDGVAISKSKRVYRLSDKDKALVNETFNKLIAAGKLLKSKNFTSYKWRVFIVRSRTKPKDKGRVVVDTRGLNQITEDDAYSLPRQESLLSFVKEKPHI